MRLYPVTEIREKSTAACYSENKSREQQPCPLKKLLGEKIRKRNVSHKYKQLTFDELLRQKLKEWREGLDDANTLFSENVVPQEERMFRNGWGCISNNDIENLIDQVPRSIKELQAIPGIGPTKLKKYGDSLLEVIEKTTEERKS